MDKAALLDLMAFTDFAWEDVEKSFNSDDDILVRSVPHSGWPTLRNCLAHILIARERWNDAIIDLRTAGLRELKDDELQTWADLNAYRTKTGSRLTDFMAGFSDDDLEAREEVSIDGARVAYSRADLITHLVLHEISHHGDITTLMYQLGKEPWIPYYRFHANRDA
jgi:uncharacterized damage-inducible protein DinB